MSKKGEINNWIPPSGSTNTLYLISLILLAICFSTSIYVRQSSDFRASPKSASDIESATVIVSSSNKSEKELPRSDQNKPSVSPVIPQVVFPSPSTVAISPLVMTTLVTQANRPNKYLCALIESSMHYDQPQAIVGWAPNAPLPASMQAVSWQAGYFHSSKVLMYYSILHEEKMFSFYPEGTLFVFVDFDNVVQFGPAELIERYKVSINKAQKAIPRLKNVTAIVATELNGPFFPNSHDLPPDRPPEGTVWYNMCSGGMMGDRAGMLQLLGEMVKHIGPVTLADRSGLIERPDQELLIELWRAGLPVALDWGMDVFLSMNIPDDKPGVTIDPQTGHGDWRGHFVFDDVEGSSTRGKMKSAHTGTTPVHVHFNGFSKSTPSSPPSHKLGFEEVFDRFEFVRARPNPAKAYIPREKFKKLVRFFDERLQLIDGVEPADVCPSGTPLEI